MIEPLKFDKFVGNLDDEFIYEDAVVSLKELGYEESTLKKLSRKTVTGLTKIADFIKGDSIVMTAAREAGDELGNDILGAFLNGLGPEGARDYPPRGARRRKGRGWSVGDRYQDSKERREEAKKSIERKRARKRRWKDFEESLLSEPDQVLNEQIAVYESATDSIFDNLEKIGLDNIDEFFLELLLDNYVELDELYEKAITSEHDPRYRAGRIALDGVAIWLSGILAFRLKRLIEPWFTGHKVEFVRNPVTGQILKEPKTGKFVKKVSPSRFVRAEARGKIYKRKILAAIRKGSKGAGKAWRFLKTGIMNHRKAAAIAAVLIIVSTAATVYYNKVYKRKSLEYRRQQAIKAKQKEIDRKLAVEIRELKRDEEKYMKEISREIEEAKADALKERDPEKLQKIINKGLEVDTEPLSSK